MKRILFLVISLLLFSCKGGDSDIEVGNYPPVSVTPEDIVFNHDGGSVRVETDAEHLYLDYLIIGTNEDGTEITIKPEYDSVSGMNVLKWKTLRFVGFTSPVSNPRPVDNVTAGRFCTITADENDLKESIDVIACFISGEAGNHFRVKISQTL